MLGPKKRIQKQFKVQKMRNYKNFGSKHFELKFRVKKELDLDIWSKNFKYKTVRVQKIFKFEKKIKNLGPKPFWVDKILDQQNFWFAKFWLQTFFILCPKILGLEKF